jgi:hypothetical protein
MAGRIALSIHVGRVLTWRPRKVCAGGELRSPPMYYFAAETYFQKASCSRDPPNFPTRPVALHE